MEICGEFMRRKDNEFKKQKPILMKDIGRNGRHYFIKEAWTFMPQHNLDKKVFVVERLRAVKTLGKSAYKKSSKNEIEYRIGYYIIGRIGNKKGRWTWGQYCPMIPKKDFNKLINKAKKEGVISK